MRVIVINPGSTSTKLALYSERGEIFSEKVAHNAGELTRFPTVSDQLEFRKQVIIGILTSKPSFSPDQLSAVIGRGGLLHPVAGGVYRVNSAMKHDLQSARYGSHASNLGALLADQLARQFGVDAFISDPIVVDELDPLARYSGIPEISRKSIFHALNQKATARKAAAKLGKKYNECNLIIAHLGGGTSVGIHQRGRVTDVNNALDGDGPFSVERAGQLPSGDWLRFILSHSEDPQSLQKRLTGRGGIVAYLGSNDFRVIERVVQSYEDGKPAEGALDGLRWLEVLKAMCYQVSKEICSLSAVVAGDVEAVVLTGGLANNKRIVEEIRSRVSFLAPVLVFPGENEMEALAAAALEVLRGNEDALEYISQ